MLSHRIRQRLLAISQLHSRLARRSKDQIGMAKSMIADDMPSPRQLARDIGSLFHVAPDEKKCRLYVVSGKNFEQTKSVRIVRTVVVGQCELPGPGF